MSKNKNDLLNWDLSRLQNNSLKLLRKKKYLRKDDIVW